MCSCCSCCSCIFLFFDTILGLSGLAVIGGGVYLLVDEKKFNSLAVILIAVGLIIFIIFIIGIKIPNRPVLLCMYLFFVTIIFLFYAGLAALVKLYPDKLINNLKDRVDEIDFEDTINDYKTYIFIGACSGAGCTLLSLITGIIYYRKLKNEDDNNGQDYELSDGKKRDALVDYSINNQEEDKNDISNKNIYFIYINIY